MPIVATSATIGILMKSIFSYDGFVNTVISGVGLEKIEWLTEPKWAFFNDYPCICMERDRDIIYLLDGRISDGISGSNWSI